MYSVSSRHTALIMTNNGRPTSDTVILQKELFSYLYKFYLIADNLYYNFQKRIPRILDLQMSIINLPIRQRALLLIKYATR